MLNSSGADEIGKTCVWRTWSGRLVVAGSLTSAQVSLQQSAKRGGFSSSVGGPFLVISLRTSARRACVGCVDVVLTSSTEAVAPGTLEAHRGLDLY